MTDLKEEVIDEMDVEMDEAKMVSEISNIPNETKQEKFLRLVNPRLQVAVKRLRLLRNLAVGDYEYTPEQAKLVMDTLGKEFDALEHAFLENGVDDGIPVIK